MNIFEDAAKILIIVVYVAAMAVSFAHGNISAAIGWFNALLWVVIFCIAEQSQK